MDDKKRICSECGTENEQQYLYCKNCGAPLTVNSQTDSRTEYNTQSNYTNANTGATQNDCICIDGIPIEEVQMFVGAKAGSMIPKFMNMEIYKSKTSWLWPPAVLGFIFGPLGAALWFFYRKMYKFAFIFVGIGAFISLFTTILSLNASVDYFKIVFDAISSGSLNELNNALDEISTDSGFLSINWASVIQDVSKILTSVVVGCLGLGWYKEHCIRKIKEFRMMNPNNGYYSLGLMSLGGTSGGMVVLGILISIILDSIISGIITVFVFLN